ncbi:hypothetical protein [Parageobacillus thermoglucosidasius]|uniref:LITAF domain-containing protein n=1 Tax=Parageobacillus thermoglucosidasius TaxID=1426 RepID=A0A1B7KUJ1_PARTM|nr:hypothetical protein [Parageobacillus thermoglucosidasius]OAT73742.1 hypothetical protein A7K69_17930 [Parageobacillus thermoglucosidasius]
MAGQTVILCPQCGGNKVRESTFLKSFLILSFFCAVTIIGIPLAIIFMLIWAFLRLSSKGHKQMVCEECKHNFSVSQSTFEQYRKAIKENETAL